MTLFRPFASPSRFAAAGLLLAALGAAPIAGAQSATAADLEAGRDYRAINPAQPTSTPDGKVEVAEVFQYSCPHCFNLEPYLEKWKAQKADYVNLVLLPASWSDLSRIHARAFYTAEALGKVEEMHQAFFKEIHVNNNLLDTEDGLADFFARFGVDEATFRKTFNSFSVHTKVQRADELIRRYRVGATPNIIVDGKYLTDGAMAGSYERWFAIIDALAAREHEKSP
ncbi:MAG TPA: thiol:disulfide interchange protein DsbA/DsbL [Gammaproteobacteria bacterium]